MRLCSVTHSKVDADFVVLIVLRNVTEQIALGRSKVEVVGDAGRVSHADFQTGAVVSDGRDRVARSVDRASRELVAWIRHLHERPDALKFAEVHGWRVETFQVQLLGRLEDGGNSEERDGDRNYSFADRAVRRFDVKIHSWRLDFRKSDGVHRLLRSHTKLCTSTGGNAQHSISLLLLLLLLLFSFYSFY